MTGSNKRKCDNNSSKGFSVVVIGDDSSFDQLQDYLQSEKSRYLTDDPVLSMFDEDNESCELIQASMLKKANGVTLEIASQTAAARDACVEESVVLQHLTDLIYTNRCKQESLLKELDNL